jgi:hypothetical protein
LIFVFAFVPYTFEEFKSMRALTAKTKCRNPYHKKPASARTAAGTVTPTAILDGPERPSAELFPMSTLCTVPLPLPLPFPFPLPALVGVGVELELEVAEATESL